MFKEYSTQKPRPVPSSKARLNRSQLPSIIRSKQSRTQSMRSNFQQHSHIDLTSYDQKSNEAIKADSKKLKLEIIDMNKKIGHVVQKGSVWKIKSLEKRGLTKEEEEIIIDKEEENTRKMVQLFSREYEQLMDKKRTLRDGSKAGNVICDIMDIQQKITNLKITLKEMKKKMYTKQKKIVEGHEQKQITRQSNLLKQLQQDYTATQSKISQMKLTMQAIESKTQRLRVQNQSSLEEYRKAEEMIREIDYKMLKDNNEQRIHEFYLEKLTQIEASKRRLGVMRSNGEQKYLGKLKELETVVEYAGQGGKVVDRKVEESREVIRQLESVLENQQAEMEMRIREEEEMLQEEEERRQREMEEQKKKVSVRLQEREEPKQPKIQNQNEQQMQQQQNHQQQQNKTPSPQKQPAKLQASSQQQQQQPPTNSMFLTMPQQSNQQNTVYKSPTKRKEEPSTNIQSNRTISLRNIEPETKPRLVSKQAIKREVANTVDKASNAIKSVENLFKDMEIGGEIEGERYEKEEDKERQILKIEDKEGQKN